MSETQCQACKGRGKVYNYSTNQYDKVCRSCGGTGEVQR